MTYKSKYAEASSMFMTLPPTGSLMAGRNRRETPGDRVAHVSQSVRSKYRGAAIDLH
jgi:hypothetical protein